MASEQRHHARAHVLRRGKIVFRRGYGVIDCVVLDLSPEGARLRVGAWLGLPERFELRIENGAVHEARGPLPRPRGDRRAVRRRPRRLTAQVQSAPAEARMPPAAMAMP